MFHLFAQRAGFHVSFAALEFFLSRNYAIKAFPPLYKFYGQ